MSNLIKLIDMLFKNEGDFRLGFRLSLISFDLNTSNLIDNLTN